MIQTTPSVPPASSTVRNNQHKEDLVAEDHRLNEERIPKTQKLSRHVRMAFTPHGPLRPFRLLNQDLRKLRARYVSDWTLFNQVIFASAVFVFFTNLLPGITFASDLYQLTGKNYGTIEVVLSTGLCGIIYSMWVYNQCSGTI